MLKLMIVGRRRGGMTVAQLHRYMVDVHGAMVLRHIAASPQLTPQRYVQNHVFDGSFRTPDPTRGGTPDPFTVSRDFITQVWFDNPAQAAASSQAPLYLNELQPDEDNFVDQASVVKMPVIAQPVYEAAHPAGCSKLFVFHRRAEGVSTDDLAASTLAQWQPLLADAALRIDRLVRNVALARPGEPAAADLVDEVWLADDAAARALGERWQALAEAPALAPLLAPRTSFGLLATELVLHAGAATPG